MSAIIRFFTQGRNKPKPASSAQAQVPVAPDLTVEGGGAGGEMYFLEGHENIVRIAVAVPQTQYLLTAGDDGKICVWDHRTGSRTAVLAGHTRPVTSLAVLDTKRSLCVSGGADRTIRLWNYATGELLQTIPPEKGHSASVRFLCLLDRKRSFDDVCICSGANDNLIIVWKLLPDKDLLEQKNRIERSDSENLSCMLPLNNETVVTGISTQSALHVYPLDPRSRYRCLTYHREAPQCLAKISDDVFACGSLDGMVILWDARTLIPSQILNFPPEYKRVQDRVFMYCVNRLLPIGGMQLVATIGNGFSVFDTETRENICAIENAHVMSVTSVVSLYNNRIIATGSSDGTIRLWRLPERKPHAKMAKSGGQGHMEAHRNASHSSRDRAPPPQFVTELFGHSGPVLDMVAVSNTSFASCGADGSVILWKDSHEQDERRNTYATLSMFEFNRDFLKEKEVFTGDQLRGSTPAFTPVPAMHDESPASSFKGGSTPLKAQPRLADPTSRLVSAQEDVYQTPVEVGPRSAFTEKIQTMSKEDARALREVKDQVEIMLLRGDSMGAIRENLKGQDYAVEVIDAALEQAEVSDSFAAKQ